MKRIEINASERYEVLIGTGLLEDAAGLIKALGAGSLMTVSDDNVYPLYGEKLNRRLSDAGLRVSSFVFPHGEKSKNLRVYGELLERMCGEGFTRSDAVIAVGGGVTGDLAGFAAATYQRGIRFVQIPTTLLAAVDSSVGGKTGVDLENGKNQVGSFHQPSLVICDADTLKTLPEEEYTAGCAEVIKYAVIGSRALYDGILQTPVKEQYCGVIGKCVEMKRDFVEKDEFDRGLRMMLNFGHTFGHAAEACSGYSILHGHAVAMGMAAVTKAAAELGLCSDRVYGDVLKILEKYGLPTRIPFRRGEMERAISVDKKAAGGAVRLIVPERIGKCVIKPVAMSEIGLWLEKGGVG